MTKNYEENIRLKKLVSYSEELFQSSAGKIDYGRITYLMKEISGAKYAAFILFDDKTNTYITKSAQGNGDHIKKACQILDFKIQGQVWERNSAFEKRIKDNIITHFSSIRELTEGLFPKAPITTIEKTFNAGQTIVANIFRNNLNLGYFILIYNREKELVNEELIEVFSRQIGLLLERKKTEEKLQFQFNYQKMISDISSKFLSIPDDEIDNAIDEALKMCRELFDVERAYLFLFSDDRKKMEKGYEQCAEGSNKNLQDIIGIELGDYPWFEKEIFGQDHMYVPDIEELPPEAVTERTKWEEYSIKSALHIPLKERSEVTGFIGFNSINKQNWSEEQITLLKVLAGIISSALEKKAEREELQIQKKRLSEAQRIGHTGSWEFDMNTGMVHASKEAFNIYGIEDTSITIREVQALVLPQFRPALDQELKDLIESNKPYYVEFSILRPIDNKICHISSVAEYYPESNTVVGTLQDITERKVSEEQLQNRTQLLDIALEATCAGIWDVDLLTGNIELQGLKSWKEITGYDYNDFSSYNLDMWIKMIHPDDAAEVISKFSDTASGKNDHYVAEYRMLHKNGNWVWIRAHGRVAGFDENGKALHVYGTHISIDENKKAEEKAKAASQAKSDFLANMSHEIRTPLNGIIGFSDLLMNSQLSSSQLQYLQTINASANSLLDLINDVLDISKIEAGKLELQNERIELRELCEQITDMLKYSAHAKGLELLTNLPPQLPEYIVADRMRLRQILVNLLGNAIKFTPSGEVELKVVVGKTDSQGKADITFSVRDTGIGIPPDKQTDIYDSFSQADSSISRKYGGTGLGLSISNKLLEKMDSELELTSEEGKGSCFSFSVDLSIKNTEISDDRISVFGKTLIVDDNEKNCQIISSILKTYGIETELAYSADEALKNLADMADEIGLMIIDRHMPLMSGDELVKEIRDGNTYFSHDLPIIIMQDSTDISDENTDEDNSVTHGKTACIIKPVKQRELLEIINHGFSDINNCIPDRNKVFEPPESSNDENYKILIAEDNETNMLLISTIVSRILPDAEVFRSRNGNEAVDIFRKERPNIILMDIQMPETSGYDATAIIRNIEKTTGTHTPIIALTAGTYRGEKEKCLKAGLDDYIPKPIVFDTIRQLFDKWLFKHNIRKENGKQKENPHNPVHFDSDWLLENTNGSKKLHDELASMAMRSFYRSHQEISAAFSKNEMDTIATIAHKTKGTALNTGFNLIASAAEDIENSTKDDPDDLPALLEKLEEEIEYLKHFFDKEH
ncbi:response regulator [Methanolobus bombayensis]|uniref:response regulator n=1 Tax=Methanolobus bombayensis TaxID=38023 RepID=UPI001AE2125B|nr:response regulator [Methanolobus bombayensis]MBP1910314.1 PAS domain S-box-containing protein [Methanolobus bombayensis]